MRRETEVHTGKQRRANTQIFCSTLHSEEGCFGITRPSGSASSGSDVREASCPVQKPATFHLQIHRKTCRTVFLFFISFGRLENQNTFVRVNIQSDVEDKLSDLLKQAKSRPLFGKRAQDLLCNPVTRMKAGNVCFCKSRICLSFTFLILRSG